MADKLSLEIITREEPAGPRANPSDYGGGRQNPSAPSPSAMTGLPPAPRPEPTSPPRLDPRTAQPAGATAPAGSGGANAAGGAALAAAGPAGLAAGAVMQVKNQRDAESARSSAELMQAMGLAADATRRLAGNDNLGALGAAGQAAALGLGRIPVVGESAATGLRAVVESTRMASGVLDAFVAQGKRLSPYSGELAGATARAEVTNLMADVREADELGPLLSRVTDSSSELTDLLKEALLPLKKFALEILAPAVEFLVELAKGARGFTDEVVAVLKAIPEAIGQAIRGQFNAAAGTITDAIDKAREDFNKREKDRQEAMRQDAIDWQAGDLGRGFFVPQGAPDPVLGGRVPQIPLNF